MKFNDEVHATKVVVTCNGRENQNDRISWKTFTCLSGTRYLPSIATEQWLTLLQLALKVNFCRSRAFITWNTFPVIKVHLPLTDKETIIQTKPVRTPSSMGSGNS